MPGTPFSMQKLSILSMSCCTFWLLNFCFCDVVTPESNYFSISLPTFFFFFDLQHFENLLLSDFFFFSFDLFVEHLGV